jgi:hypothetical protein
MACGERILKRGKGRCANRSQLIPRLLPPVYTDGIERDLERFYNSRRSELIIRSQLRRTNSIFVQLLGTSNSSFADASLQARSPCEHERKALRKSPQLQPTEERPGSGIQAGHTALTVAIMPSTPHTGSPFTKPFHMMSPPVS